MGDLEEYVTYFFKPILLNVQSTVQSNRNLNLKRKKIERKQREKRKKNK